MRPVHERGARRQIINLTQTTSGSYLLMVSLDISRKNLALHGKEIFRKVVDLTTYAREEINAIGDYYAYGSELINGDTVYDFDTTKLAVNTLDVGLAGIEVYDILRDFYDIQTEFGDLGNLLAYVSVGDRERDLERLVAALADIRRRYQARQGDAHAAGVYLSAGGRRPAGGVLRGQEGHAAREVGRTHLRGVCHVLSARHPDPRAR